MILEADDELREASPLESLSVSRSTALGSVFDQARSSNLDTTAVEYFQKSTADGELISAEEI